MRPLSRVVKSLSVSDKLSLVAMLFLALSFGSSQLSRVQKQKEQAAITVSIQKRRAALDALSGEIARTSAEMKRLDASGQMTSADLKRFEMQSMQYKVRLKAIETNPCP